MFAVFLGEVAISMSAMVVCSSCRAHLPGLGRAKAHHSHQVVRQGARPYVGTEFIMILPCGFRHFLCTFEFIDITFNTGTKITQSFKGFLLDAHVVITQEANFFLCSFCQCTVRTPLCQEQGTYDQGQSALRDAFLFALQK